MLQLSAGVAAVRQIIKRGRNEMCETILERRENVRNKSAKYIQIARDKSRMDSAGFFDLRGIVRKLNVPLCLNYIEF